MEKERQLLNSLLRLTAMNKNLFEPGDEFDFYGELMAIKNKLENIPYIPFPICLKTIDAILVLISGCRENTKLLLGRKKTEDKFRFIGGFVDAGETTKAAMKREVKEETNISPELYDIGKYSFEEKINDSRYEKTPHRIVSHVYILYLKIEALQYMTPMDDIYELKLFSLSDLKKDYERLIMPCHFGIMAHFLNFHNKKK